MSTEFRLSIDYGTTNTVAYLQPPGEAPFALQFNGGPLLPSAVWADEHRSLVTGHNAVRSARLDPGRYEPNPKRRIGERKVLLGGDEFDIAQLIGATLAQVYGEAVRMARTDRLRVVLTHPAAWSADRQGVLRAAAGHAGLHQPTLVSEPEAAAAQLIASGAAVADGDPLVVYDLGAGTCDVTAVLRTGREFQQLAKAGVDDVGGLDLDEVVQKRVGRTIGDRYPDEWARLMEPEGTDRWLARLLWDDCRGAKERLSTERVARVQVPLIDEDVSVTRGDFERDARPLLQRTVAMTEQVLRRAKIGRDDRAELFLVGGATRTPLVGTLLGQATGRSPRRVEHPELVVAEGALRYLAMQANEPAPRPRTMQMPATPATPMTPVTPAAPQTLQEPVVVDAAPPTRRESVTVKLPPQPAPAFAPPPGAYGAPPPPVQDKRKLIPNPYRFHGAATFRFAAVLAVGLVLGFFDGVLFTVLSWLLILGGGAGTAWKLFQWALSARDTRPLRIDGTGITVTKGGQDTTFPWSLMATVYIRPYRSTRWLVCTPASNTALGSDHGTARFWSRPYSVFFLTSTGGFGDDLVKEALEQYAGERYPH
ncbi:Hsp70 family protein [Dactylosporangium vinaceum]|uniref:Hsp70 family protein n=1 Tax=Dactylosporangium vinaceum TaxID=53362 RepID=A0ABV5M977_9ACTN|nr:Hsp70 family protein [Dactylosporangium vinaceum]UAB99469.1 Hsp70 family protein [Dactylosporangium vinaceum]